MINTEAPPAGRALDVLVAEHIMGYRRWEFCSPPGSDQWWVVLRHPLWDPVNLLGTYRPSTSAGTPYESTCTPAYSTSLSAVLEVVERLQDWCDVYLAFTKTPGEPQCCRLEPLSGARAVIEEADTMPLAICRAALRLAGMAEKETNDND